MARPGNQRSNMPRNVPSRVLVGPAAAGGRPTLFGAPLVQDAIEAQLRRFPGLGRPGLVEETREFVLPRLGVVITYRVEDGALWVLGILHGSHEPREEF